MLLLACWNPGCSRKGRLPAGLVWRMIGLGGGAETHTPKSEMMTRRRRRGSAATCRYVLLLRAVAASQTPEPQTGLGERVPAWPLTGPSRPGRFSISSDANSALDTRLKAAFMVVKRRRWVAKVQTSRDGLAGADGGREGARVARDDWDWGHAALLATVSSGGFCLPLQAADGSTKGDKQQHRSR